MKVAVYTRVSTEDQAREGYSIEVQREYLLDHAKRLGWEVYKIYNDDESGYILDRSGLKEMLKDAKAKRFELIITYKLDRFSRKLKDLLNIVDELEAYGVAYKSATEPFDTTTSAGKLMFQQLGSFAEFERNRIKERVFPGMIKGVQQGNWQGARFAPYGYRYIKEKRLLEVIPEEADIVKLIYTMYLANKTTGEITEYLYVKGYKTRCGGKFYTKLVRDILRNQFYLGKLVWNRKHYDTKQTTKTRVGYRYVKNDPSKVIIAQGKHQPLICQEDFDLVQNKLDNNRKGVLHRRNVFEYPLTGILYCAKCKYRYQGTSGTSNHRTKKRKRWYKCSCMQNHHIKCGNPAVKAEDIEPQVFDIIKKILSHRSIVQGRLDSIAKAHVYLNNSEIQQEFDLLNDALRTNLSKQSKLNDSYMENLIGVEIYKDKVSLLREEEKRIKSEIAKVKIRLIEKEQSEAYLRVLNLAIANFDTTTRKIDIIQKKETLKLIFKSVEINGGRMVSVRLYPPFQEMYEEVLKECNVLKNQEITAKNRQAQEACILLPTVAR
ncbi:MAG: recombinase family protein [Candidatus Omnitrophica bacterium]|nr:recombinase family protein [Candidatus Omnitrophota bacterium]